MADKRDIMEGVHEVLVEGNPQVVFGKRWVLTNYFCPACGKVGGVWSDTYLDEDGGHEYMCIECEVAFHLPHPVRRVDRDYMKHALVAIRGYAKRFIEVTT
jgi:hypothetical protein